MSSTSPIALQELLKQAFDDFAIPVYEDAPFTTIQNRAKVNRSLKAVAGIERVHTYGINLLNNEFGPNGEQVYEALNQDARIRFVGNWSSFSGSFGTGVSSSTIGNYVEVTFYGTGLNVTAIHGSGLLRDARVSVDGGSPGSNIFPGTSGTQSLVINNRNYSSNQVFPALSGLALGWHTAKIEVGAGNTDSVALFGFEILNQRTDIAVYPGSAIPKGSLVGIGALATSSFNEGVSGTKGARVVKYIEGANLKTAVTNVDASAQYLTSADHTNEEVVSRINFRQFGANRADDFSGSPSGFVSRAFTLDDGTTTVHMNNGYLTNGGLAESIWPEGSGGFVAITFVGTGLDIETTMDGQTTRDCTVSVDGGSSVGTTSRSGANSGKRIVKVVSGLSYGTHTVKFLKSGTFATMITDFIIYQPKKPSIPDNAFEVADYNVNADVSAAAIANVSNGEGIISGMIWKPAMREVVYVGSWIVGSIASYRPKSVAQTYTSTIGNYCEYTFFGDSIAVELDGSSANTTCSIQIDGVLNASGTIFGTGITNAGGGTYNLLTPDSATAGIVLFTGLSFGPHTIRVTKTGAAAALEVNGFFVAPRIHINEPSFKVGSQSLKSIEKTTPETVKEIPDKLSTASGLAPSYSARAWVNFEGTGGIGLNAGIRSGGNVSSVGKIGTGSYLVNFQTPMQDAHYTVALAARRTSTNSDFLATLPAGGTYSPYSVQITSTVASVVAIENSDLITVTVFR